MFFRNFTNKLVSIMLAGVIGFSPIVAVAAEEGLFVLDSSNPIAIEMDGVKTLEGESDNVYVRASALEKSFNGGESINVSELSIDSDKYEDVLTTAMENTLSEETAIIGFSAIDLSVVNGDEVVDAEGTVALDITYKNGKAPEMEPFSDAKIILLQIDADANGVISCENLTDNSDVKINADETMTVSSIQLSVDRLSTFALVWIGDLQSEPELLDNAQAFKIKWSAQNRASCEVKFNTYLLDENGSVAPISTGQKNIKISSSSDKYILNLLHSDSTNIDANGNKFDISSYTKDGEKYFLYSANENSKGANIDSNKIKYLRTQYKNGSWQIRVTKNDNDSGWHNLSDTKEINLYYTKSALSLNVTAYQHTNGSGYDKPQIKLPIALDTINLRSNEKYVFNEQSYREIVDGSRRYVLNHVVIYDGTKWEENATQIQTITDNGTINYKFGTIYYSDNNWSKEFANSGIKLCYDIFDTNVDANYYNSVQKKDLSYAKLEADCLPSKINLQKLVKNGQAIDFKNSEISEINGNGEKYILDRVTFINTNNDRQEVEIKSLVLKETDKGPQYFCTDKWDNVFEASACDIIAGLNLYYTKLITVTGVSLADYEHMQDSEYHKGEAENRYLFTFAGAGADSKAWNQCHMDQAYQGLASNTYVNGFKLADNLSQYTEYFPAQATDSNISEAHSGVGLEFVVDGDGYYVIDSRVSKYLYDSSANQITLVGPYINDPHGGFWPFGVPTQGFPSEVHFGMTVPLEFSITPTGTVDGKEYNGSNGTVFEFAGDDDVFVYIDGKLVLDLGGIHNSISGSINFATGEVKIQGQSASKDNIYNFGQSGLIGTPNIYSDIFKKSRVDFADTYHKMTVVYFERGANVSNCKIKYNFVPINAPDTTSVSFTKVDEVMNPIQGAKFELFDANNYHIQYGVSDENGIVNFLALRKGTYTFKEIAGSNGKYTIPQNAIWKLEVYENGYRLETRISSINEEAQELSANTQDNSFAVINKTCDTTSINVIKKWVGVESASELPTNIIFDVQGFITDGDQKQYITDAYTLSGDDQTIFKKYVLNKPASDTVVDWNGRVDGLPQYFGGDSNKPITWQLFEESIDGFVVLESSMNEDNTEFIVTNTKGSVVAQPEDIELIDKTADADGRDAVIELNVLDGQKQVTYLEEIKTSNVVLVFDASMSMKFPSDLEATDIDSFEKLDKNRDKIYYAVANTSAATVYRIWYSSDAKSWVYCDASLDHEVKDGKRKAFDYNSTDSLVGAKPVLYKWTTGKTRLDYLTEETKKLIDILPVGSKVSLDIFNAGSKAYNFDKAVFEQIDRNRINNYVFTIKDNQSRTQIKNIIDGYKKVLASQTRQDLGLADAKTLIDNYYSKNPEAKQQQTNVIFVTDGCPNGGSVDVVKNATANAKAIKEKSKLFSVGIDLDLNEQMAVAKKLMRDCASSKEEGGSYCFNGASNDLAETFAELATIISNGTIIYTYKTGDVVDVLDRRFDLVLDNGSVVTNSYDSIARVTDQGKVVVGGKEAVLSITENGLLKITWLDQSLGEFVEGKATGQPLSLKFRVRAKSDFLGGNMIATNDPESGVYEPDEDPKKFPEPSVNVPRLDFTLADDEEILFLGEEITDVYDYKTAIAAILATAKNAGDESMNYAEVLSIDNFKTVIESPTFAKPDSNNKFSIEADYKYKGTEDIVGKLVYEVEVTGPDNYATLMDNKYYATRTGAPVQKYTLTIKYEPIALDKRKLNLAGTGINVPGYGDKNPGSEQSNMEASGNYYVTVIDAKAEITKLGQDEGGNQPLEGVKFDHLVNNKSLVEGGLISSKDGLVKIDKLYYGRNEFKELETVTGYALTDDTYYIDVKATDGNTKNTGSYNITISENAKNKSEDLVILKYDYSQLREKVDQEQMNEAKAITMTFDVINYRLAELPQTGGSGTHIYTITGLLLIFAALLCGYIKKRSIKTK